MAPLFPADFFTQTVAVKKQGAVLPDLSSLLAEDCIAEVSFDWSEEGIGVKVAADYLLEECYFPQYEKGDAWEFFFDVRDNKQSSIPSRFCHHFLVHGASIDGIHAREISKCRAEDSHPLCDPVEIVVNILNTKKGYEMKVFFPKEILHGYDPIQFAQIGFAYRIHRYKGSPQHFPVSGKYIDLWQNPALWASILLTQ
jgi:hypothetical protein